MKSLMRLLLCVLEDSSIQCCTSTTRDWVTITRRVEHEGMSFLTITLPKFCSDFERGLEQGFVSPDLFLGYKKRQSLPAFLQGLTGRVFNSASGVLLQEPDIDAILCIRQICLMFKKVLLPCSPERERRAFVRFLECDKEVARLSRSRDTNLLREFAHVSRLLWGNCLREIDTRIELFEHIPRHGPGATAERISGNQKFAIQTWHERLEESFPSADFVIPNYGYFEALSKVDFLEPGQELPVRVISVPKTQSTPRIIAIEPVCMQYAQQSIMELLVDQLETHKYTRGHLNFSDQTINGRLARASSLDGSLATIDLKDASDRVGADLVDVMLECAPSLRKAVFACRSYRASVPGHDVHHLSKFASMGSALCFPIESMVFYTICLVARLKSQGLHLSEKNLLKVKSGVHVYGDDIIVPTDSVQSVCCELEAFGLLVNQHKSFFKGNFRESCGVDAFCGYDVKPVYVRRLLPDKRHQTEEMLSAISLANQLYKAGFWRSCKWLRTYVERLAPVPFVLDTSPIHGWHSFLGMYDKDRFCKDLQVPLVRGIVPQPIYRESVIDDYPAMMKWFLKRGVEPFQDRNHLRFGGRPVSVNTKIRWAKPY